VEFAGVNSKGRKRGEQGKKGEKGREEMGKQSEE